MAIPDYQECMLPLLQVLSDGEQRTLRDATSRVADKFELSDEERQLRLPSGQNTVIANRVGWAKTYLKKAGLIANPNRGTISITAEGKAVLLGKPSRIDNDFLKRFSSFVDFVGCPNESEAPEQSSSSETPEELLEASYLALRDALTDDLLERIKICSSQFLEQLVVELLVAMGYGGSLNDAGKAVGRSGDGGIDGIIKEDKLGLDVVCIQAKRWSNTVGRPEVAAFAGSMEGFRARKGVLLTTSRFSKDADDFVNRIERKIVLIDGTQLARLMIEHNIGVATARTYEIKKLDLDYFDEESE